MAGFSYDVKKVIGQLDSDSNATKELRIISWNGAEPKYDLRGWWKDEEGNEKMTKGITLDREELLSLYDILSDYLDGEEDSDE